MTIEIYSERRHYGRVIEISFIERRADHVLVGQKLTMVRIGEDESPEHPTVSLSVKAAQQLMDQLWACGLRPAEGVGSAGAAAAMQEHLKDMRAVAFTSLKKLGIE